MTEANLQRAIAGLALAIAAVSAPGCKGGKKAPDCKGAASAFAELIKRQVDADTATDPTRRAQALSLIPTFKEEMAKECEKKNWPESTRRCIAQAKDQGDLAHCMPAQPGSSAPTAQPAPSAAPPAPAGAGQAPAPGTTAPPAAAGGGDKATTP
jgi:hypothetical protein